jgi:hypothetical protein
MTALAVWQGEVLQVGQEIVQPFWGGSFIAYRILEISSYSVTTGGGDSEAKMEFKTELVNLEIIDSTLPASQPKGHIFRMPLFLIKNFLQNEDWLILD